MVRHLLSHLNQSKTVNRMSLSVTLINMNFAGSVCSDLRSTGELRLQVRKLREMFDRQPQRSQVSGWAPRTGLRCFAV